MLRINKRIFLLSILLSFSSVIVAQNKRNVNCNPGKGCQDIYKGQNHHQNPLDDTTTSGGISADPNEIIGPAGYDSIRWVSINDVLNYTILFENDSEFASANAQ